MKTPSKRTQPNTPKEYPDIRDEIDGEGVRPGTSWSSRVVDMYMVYGAESDGADEALGLVMAWLEHHNWWEAHA